MRPRQAALLAATAILIFSSCDGGGGGGEARPTLTDDPTTAETTPTGPAEGDVLLSQGFEEDSGPFTLGEKTDGEVRMDPERQVLVLTVASPAAAYEVPATLSEPSDGLRIETELNPAPTLQDDLDILGGVACDTEEAGGHASYLFLISGVEEAYIARDGAGEGDFSLLESGPIDLSASAGVNKPMEVTCSGAGEGQPVELSMSVGGEEVLDAEDPDGIGTFTGVSLRVDASLVEEKKTEGQFWFWGIHVTAL